MSPIFLRAPAARTEILLLPVNPPPPPELPPAQIRPRLRLVPLLPPAAPPPLREPLQLRPQLAAPVRRPLQTPLLPPLPERPISSLRILECLLPLELRFSHSLCNRHLSKALTLSVVMIAMKYGRLSILSIDAEKPTVSHAYRSRISN